MSLKIKTTQIEYATIPENTYGAICYAVIDIGLQYNERWNKTSQKIIIIWEIVDDDLREDFGKGKPERRVISKTYTASLNKKSSLYQDLRPWIGDIDEEEFDLSTLVGKACMLSITNTDGADGKTYANVAGVSKVMKGVNLGKSENPLIIYDIEESSEEIFEKLPEWIQKKIKESKNPDSGQANSIDITVDTETGEVIESKPEKLPKNSRKTVDTAKDNQDKEISTFPKSKTPEPAPETSEENEEYPF